MRSLLHYLFIPFWVARSLALKTYWRLRAVGFRFYWIMRSFPYRIKLWARNVFYKHLYKYTAIKAFRSWLRSLSNQTFKLKTRLIHGLKGRKYHLVASSSFIANNGLNSLVIDPAGDTNIKGPRFIGDYDFSPVGDHIVKLALPKLEIMPFNEAVVIGGTNFVIFDGCAIHPDEYIPERDVCPAELNGIAKIDLHSKLISIHSGREKKIEKAVSLLGSCTGNYAHWLTETLPKLLLVDSTDEFNDYPLLVDDWIHPNFLDSIALLNKNNREIIRARRWEACAIESLVEISPSAYVPPEYRYFLDTKKLDSPRSNDFPFSRTALNMLRDSVTRAVGSNRPDGPKKIYLYRSRESCGNTRHVLNIEAIERLVKAHDYEMIDPAKFSFREQVLLFANAEKIVSPLGAALANTIFTRPGCKIVGLSPYYVNANYYYFSNFMGALGHELYYVLGPQKNQGGHPFHKDYEIDINALARALEFLDSK